MWDPHCVGIIISKSTKEQTENGKENIIMSRMCWLLFSHLNQQPIQTQEPGEVS